MEVKNKKISNYIYNDELKIEELINDFYKYVNTIIMNSGIYLSDEDREEMSFDVFLAIWKNLKKLDINKNMNSYIIGITKNLIKKKYRDFKIDYNIDDYEENLISSSDIEIFLIEVEQKNLLLMKLENLKKLMKRFFYNIIMKKKV